MDKIFSPIKQRVCLYLEYKHIGKETFFANTHISASNFKGKGTLSELGGDKIVRILTKYSDINPEWLLTGQGKMLKSDANSNDKKVSIQVPIMATKDNKSIIQIPIVDIGVAAGGGFFNKEYIDEVDSIVMPASMLKTGKQYLCVSVKGDSMNPSIINDGYLIISLLDKSEWMDIKDNYVYVVSDRIGNAYVKRLKNRLKEYGFIVCTSDNPIKQLYPNFNIDEADINTVWYAEWYFSAKIPNIQEQFYSKQMEFEDRLEALTTQFNQFQKALLIKNQ